MKSKLIIVSWLASLMLLATDNLVQGAIALCWFGASSWMLERNKDEVMRWVKRMEKRIDRIINL